MPDVLYKYMSLSTATIVLENQTLRWSTPATLNDPYDIQFDLRIDFDREKVLTSALEKSWKVYKGELFCTEGSHLKEVMELLKKYCPNMPKEHFTKELSAAIAETFNILDTQISDVYKFTREFLSTSKILCLTDSPTNQLMWAYYADSNKGVVLRFEQEPGADSPYSMAKKINYSKEIPSLFDEHELSEFLSGLSIVDQQKRVNDLIYTKSSAWAHEQEWRIFAGDGRNKLAPHEDIKFGHRELTGIIVGCRMPDNQREHLALLATRLYPHAEILQAATINHTYQLELQPFAKTKDLPL